MANGIVGLLIAATLSLLPAAAQAQERVRVRSDACATCQLRLTREAVLGRGATLLTALTHVVVDSESRFIAGNSYDRSAPLVLHDRDGRELLTFGRSGRGPGEFNFIYSLHILPGDSILAIEGATATLLAPGLGG